MNRYTAMAGALVLGAAVAALAIAPRFLRHQRNEDFIPAEDVAQRAVETYLTAWQHGESVQPVANTSPAVSGGDLLQSSGRKLEAFTILGPVAADAPRCFAVKLTLGGPTEERRERYVVIGMDPLWVMRFDDYVMLLHWDHPMPSAKKSNE
jgi:hypothetical protein